MSSTGHHHRRVSTQKNKPYKGSKGVKKKLQKNIKKSKKNLVMSIQPLLTKKDRKNIKNIEKDKKHEKWVNKHITLGLTQSSLNQISTNQTSTSTNTIQKFLPPKLITLISLHSSISSFVVKNYIAQYLLNQNDLNNTKLSTHNIIDSHTVSDTNMDISDQNFPQNYNFITINDQINGYDSQLNNLKVNDSVSYSNNYQNFSEHINSSQYIHSFSLPNYAHHPSLGKGTTQSISLLHTEHELESCLDAAKCADVILFLMGDASYESPAFDEFGYKIITCLKQQGFSSPIGVCCQFLNKDLNGQKKKKKEETIKFAKRYFFSEFGNSEKFLTLDTENDIRSLLRTIGVITPQTVYWRQNKGYLLCEKFDYSQNDNQLSLYGYIRGTGFTLNYPVHITGLGDYIINSIETYKNKCLSMPSKDLQADYKVQINEKIMKNILEQEWETLRPFNPLDGEQTWPEADEMMQNEEDVDMNNSEDESDEDFELNEDYSQNADDMSEPRKPSIEIDERSKEDLMFPDEVDTPTDKSAKERFQKYRGLKSFKHSDWDPFEELPIEYSRIFDFDSFKNTMTSCEKIYNESAKSTSKELGGLTLCKMTLNFDKNDLLKLMNLKHIILSSLLPYERKVSVLHFEITKSETYTQPIPSKQNVELHCGFHRFFACPIFYESTIKSPTNKYKYERFLHPNKTHKMVLFGQCMSPSCPVVMYSKTSSVNEEMLLMAWGTFQTSEANKMIIKRIVLTGYPFRVHKKKAVVRFMFFNPEDIRWFKPIELHTKKGLTGNIISPLGTHGYMKCIFNGFITSDDTVCMYLYKRVFPKWFPLSWNGFSTLDAYSHPPLLH